MVNSHDEALARSAVYELLSMAFLYPDGESAAKVADATFALSPLASSLGWGQVEQDLDDLGQRAAQLTEEALIDEHIQVFGHIISPDCAPYEAEYGQAHVFQNLTPWRTWLLSTTPSVSPPTRSKKTGPTTSARNWSSCTS